MEKNLDMTKPRYSEQSLPVPYVGYVGSTVDISLPNIELQAKQLSFSL